MKVMSFLSISVLIMIINTSQFQAASGGSTAIQCPSNSTPLDGFPSGLHVVGHEYEPFCLQINPSTPCDTNTGFNLMQVANGSNPPQDGCVLFAPFYPLVAIDQIIADLNTLMANEEDFNISTSQFNELIKKLQQASSKVQSNNYSAAIGMLNSFNNQINAFINSGHILLEDVDELIADVNTIIISLR
jgi:hypothetical protein